MRIDENLSFLGLEIVVKYLGVPIQEFLIKRSRVPHDLQNPLKMIVESVEFIAADRTRVADPGCRSDSNNDIAEFNRE